MHVKNSLVCLFSYLLILARFCLAVKLSPGFLPAGTGKTFIFKWTEAVEPVKLELAAQPAGDGQGSPTVLVIAHAVTGGSYEWTPPTTLASGNYLVIINDAVGGPGLPPVHFHYDAPGSTPSPVANPIPTSILATLLSPPPAQAMTSPSATGSTARPTRDPLDDWDPLSGIVGGGSSTLATMTSTTASSTPTPELTTKPSTPDPGSSGQPPMTEAGPQVSFSGLTTAEKVGIGVGTAVFGIMLICAAAWIFYRKGRAAGARRGEIGREGAAEKGSSIEGMAELGVGHEVSELDARGNTPVELDASNGDQSNAPSESRDADWKVDAADAELDGLWSPAELADSRTRKTDEGGTNTKYII